MVTSPDPGLLACPSPERIAYELRVRGKWWPDLQTVGLGPSTIENLKRPLTHRRKHAPKPETILALARFLQEHTVIPEIERLLEGPPGASSEPAA
jgi:hypothetical protein